jgi:hypothetical protein
MVMSTVLVQQHISPTQAPAEDRLLQYICELHFLLQASCPHLPQKQYKQPSNLYTDGKPY